MTALVTRLPAALRRESGQGLPEYALILGLIAVFCLAALTLLGNQIGSVLNFISDTLSV